MSQQKGSTLLPAGLRQGCILADPDLRSSLIYGNNIFLKDHLDRRTNLIEIGRHSK